MGAVLSRGLNPSRPPRSREIPGEWLPGPGSAQPIAQRRPQGDLDAVAASWTIRSEENGLAMSVTF
jgi:hypothetical protein